MSEPTPSVSQTTKIDSDVRYHYLTQTVEVYNFDNDNKIMMRHSSNFPCIQRIRNYELETLNMLNLGNTYVRDILGHAVFS